MAAGHLKRRGDTRKLAIEHERKYMCLMVNIIYPEKKQEFMILLVITYNQQVVVIPLKLISELK